MDNDLAKALEKRQEYFRHGVAREIMSRNATDNIHRKSIFVVLITRNPNNGLSHAYSGYVTQQYKNRYGRVQCEYGKSK
ncbi:hypothetical protein ABDZ15_14495 [Mycobacterium canetti]